MTVTTEGMRLAITSSITGVDWGGVVAVGIRVGLGMGEGVMVGVGVSLANTNAPLVLAHNIRPPPINPPNIPATTKAPRAKLINKQLLAPFKSEVSDKKAGRSTGCDWAD